ncbi:hypothetical protein [Streptomyces longispororuber]|uniref:hypothetical protein n=1 Tax=Streptomyces longispororuber TaxID=68230 RepID=UPI00210A20E0|nr:hypothetical protein [Streptomyces longispororuber]MCQ4207394.1 hypothetical protein [Streptomyces longispororuber]
MFSDGLQQDGFERGLARKLGHWWHRSPRTSRLPDPALTLDDLLDDAFCLPHAADEAELAASRARLERDVGESLWMSAVYWDDAQTDVQQPPAGVLPAPRVPGTPPTYYDMAGGDLQDLATLMIHDERAAANIALLVSEERIDPTGARIFAALLYLADREEGAVFWWQFAAGAGSTVSAYCLYLLHLRRGALREADHWLTQAARLAELHGTGYYDEDAAPDSEVSQARWPELHLADSDRWLDLGELGPELDVGLSGDRPAHNRGLSCSLNNAVQRLEALDASDADYRSIPKPDKSLAAQLQDSPTS